ncbi:hypothetical protein [Piscicoccus intestinalis]|uniref:hypothetical protein n=1 Tax=Piscicoccus intestinalis TaxID=746033 RepID=UPI0012EE727C|nr:hypothetical protein [Piscicoccus intestinalis]
MGDFFRQGGNGSLLYIGPLVAGLLLGRFIFARGPRWLMIVEASLAIFALLIALPYTGFLSILAPLGFMVGDLAGRNNYKKALMDHEKPSE